MADFGTFNDTDSPDSTNVVDGTNPTIKAVVEPTNTTLLAATNSLVTKGLSFGKDSLNNYYPLTVDASGRIIISSIISTVAVTQSTSPWVVSGTVTAAEDKGYGTVGANTMRAAAQIGNAAGQADFAAGNTSAQTLRVVVASNQAVIPVGGNVANAATDSGNPVKIGAVFLTTQPTVTNNQRVNLQATNRGALIVSTGVDSFNINNVTGTISLPTGAATSALQTTGNASLSSIDTKLTSPLSVTGPLTDTELRATPVPVSVSNFPATQAVTQSTSPWVVSGTITSAEDKDYGTVGAATLRTAAQIGNATGAASFGAGATNSQTLRVVIPTDQTAIPSSQSGSWTVAATQSGTWNIGTLTSITNPVAVTQSTSPWVVSGTVTANAGTGTFAISAASLPLPTGASTSALQTTGNASLSSIDSKTPALGQALAAASVPVVLTAAQIATLTPLSTVAVTQSTSPWVVSGTVTANAGTGTFAVSAVSLPLPSGAATSALQTTGNASLSNIDTKLVQLALNYGVATGALRVASQIGNVSGIADFNSGATGAQTLRTVANQGAPNTAANAWLQKITDGTDTAAVTANNDLAVSDGLSNGGTQGALSLVTGGTTYQAKVGASSLTNLKSLTITALDDMYWGYSNTVTTATGTPLYKNQTIVFDVDPDSTFQVWLVASGNNKAARIAESP